MARPSSTADTMVAKLSSARTISTRREIKMRVQDDQRFGQLPDALLATAVPDPMATPISAFLRAGASFTPSPVCREERERQEEEWRDKSYMYINITISTMAETAPSS